MLEITPKALIEDPFSKSIRRYIPWQEYLNLSETHRSVSLCSYSIENINRDVILKRVDELEKLEKTGFVFVAEKKWLLSYVHNLEHYTYPKYSDWVYQIFQNIIMTKLLKWGVYEDEKGHTSEKYQDIWCGVTGNTNLLPIFSEFQTAHLIESLSEDGELEIEIYGRSDKPNPIALVNAFEFLHDLPYYTELAKDTLLNDEYYIYLEGVLVTDLSSNMNFDIAFGTEYANGIGIEFKNRKRENYRYYLYEQIPYLKSLIKRNLKPYNIPELPNLLSSDIIEDRFTSNFRKTLFSYLDLFAEKDYKEIVSAIWEADYRLNKEYIPDVETLEVISFSSLHGCEIDCQKCHAKFITALSFRWGTKINYPVYKVGDTIKWGSSNTGADYYDELYIAGYALNKCGHCKQSVNEALIHIEQNKITGYSQAKILKTKYGLSSAPYISKALIPVKEFEEKYFQECIGKALDRYDNALLGELEKLVDQIKSPEGCSSRQINIKRHFYRLRHYFEEAEYERISRFLNFEFFTSNHDVPIEFNSPVKSCCILKNIKIGYVTSDYVFYWGNLLNFPEYYLADEIQWSEYSVGDESMADMYLIAHALKSPYSDFKTIRIHLKNGIIAAVLPYSSQATGIFNEDFRIAYYPDNEPYLTWKDRYIMRY